MEEWSVVEVVVGVERVSEDEDGGCMCESVSFSSLASEVAGCGDEAGGLVEAYRRVVSFVRWQTMQIRCRGRDASMAAKPGRVAEFRSLIGGLV